MIQLRRGEVRTGKLLELVMKIHKAWPCSYMVVNAVGNINIYGVDGVWLGYIDMGEQKFVDAINGGNK